MDTVILETDEKKFKYQQIYKELYRAITCGEYQEGQRLPSEAELVEQFKISRPTVTRALRDLQQRGLVERLAGSGTYVRLSDSVKGYVFGLLIPELGQTEIFEPICRGMAHTRGPLQHALLWGNSMPSSDGSQAEELCESYISRKVSGVFFAPFRPIGNNVAVNRRIVDALDKARIPVVLLDRCVSEYPHRSNHDLVGIDHRRAGFTITEHVLKLGCRRIAFIAAAHHGSPTMARLAGYREALYCYDVTPDPRNVRRGDPADQDFVRQVWHELNPEAFVCSTDRIAAEMMRHLISMGLRIPNDVRIVGIDDYKYSSLLHVPLTTLRQPCEDIGAIAIAAMLERIAHPDMPARDILLNCKLIVRESCGAKIKHER